MQCYQTLAAATLVAKTLDRISATKRQLPYAVAADWMEQHDIDPEEILFAGEDALLARLDSLITRSHVENRCSGSAAAGIFYPLNDAA